MHSARVMVCTSTPAEWQQDMGTAFEEWDTRRLIALVCIYIGLLPIEAVEPIGGLGEQ